MSSICSVNKTKLWHAITPLCENVAWTFYANVKRLVFRSQTQASTSLASSSSTPPMTGPHTTDLNVNETSDSPTGSSVGGSGMMKHVTGNASVSLADLQKAPTSPSGSLPHSPGVTVKYEMLGATAVMTSDGNSPGLSNHHHASPAHQIGSVHTLSHVQQQHQLQQHQQPSHQQHTQLSSPPHYLATGVSFASTSPSHQVAVSPLHSVSHHTAQFQQH